VEAAMGSDTPKVKLLTEGRIAYPLTHQETVQIVAIARWAAKAHAHLSYIQRVMCNAGCKSSARLKHSANCDTMVALLAEITDA
jgi:hypothetical protein